MISNATTANNNRAKPHLEIFTGAVFDKRQLWKVGIQSRYPTCLISGNFDNPKLLMILQHLRKTYDERGWQVITLQPQTAAGREFKSY